MFTTKKAKQSCGLDPRISEFHERASFVGEASLSDSLQNFRERKDPLGKHRFCGKQLIGHWGLFSVKKGGSLISFFALLAARDENRLGHSRLVFDVET